MLAKNIKKIDIFDIITVLIIVLYVSSFFIINFKGLYIVYDSDMYADTLISKYIWNYKSIFPDHWIFGNQCFVIGTPVIAAFVYGICRNMFLSISIATTIETILIIIVFVWMIKPFISNKSITIGILILLSSAIGCEIGKQLEGQLFYLTVSYYSSYMITLLLVGGCFARIVDGIKVNRILYCLSLLFSMACGMQSLRQTALMVIPLFMCCFIYRKKECFVYTLQIFVFNISGIILIRIFGPKFNTIYGGSSITSFSDLIDKILNGFDAIKKISGIRWLIKGNIVGLFGLLLFILTCVCIVFIIFYRKNNGITSLVYLFLFGIISTIGASIFTKVNLRYIYIFSYYPLVAVSCSYLVNLLEYCNIKTHKLLYFTICVSLIVGSFRNLTISYWQEVRESLFCNDVSIEKDVCDYINSNDFNYVYMDWSHLGKCINLEDRIIAGAWSKEPFCIIEYLNAQDVYDEYHNKKAVYWLYKDEVNSAIEIANKNNAVFSKIKEFNGGEIQLFTSDKQLMYFDK